MILSGDIGGTKTRLAFYEFEAGKAVLRDMETYDSQAYAGLEEILTDFMSRGQSGIEAACLGVPGPVRGGAAYMTNLNWRLKEEALCELIAAKRFRLLNDLVITAAALPYLAESDLIVLHPGDVLDNKSRKATSVVLAPGTGLGQAFLSWEDGQPRVHPSEGGHVDFAARDELEWQLLAYLKARFGRVSYERVISGPGLVNIYDFLRDSGTAPISAELAKAIGESDPASVIASNGQSGKYEICVKALDMFASILGAVAGNLALTLLAQGGIYLGGGIPPKIAGKLQDGTFTTAYLAKGRLSPVVAATPCYIIRDDKAALLGAAHLSKLSLSVQEGVASS